MYQGVTRAQARGLVDGLACGQPSYSNVLCAQAGAQERTPMSHATVSLRLGREVADAVPPAHEAVPFFGCQREDRPHAIAATSTPAAWPSMSPEAATADSSRRPRGTESRSRFFGQVLACGPARPGWRRLPDGAQVAHRSGRRPRARSSTWSATGTRATPAPTWTGRCLEGDPHSVIEGMIIGASRSARRTGLHIRPRRVPAGRRNASRAHQPGRGGRTARAKNILGSGFGFDMRDRARRRAPSCAARRPRCMASIEGGRASRAPKPPYPAERGYGASPR